MTPAEAAVLTGIAASFDNRKPDEAAATAWAMALDGLRFEDCRDAIVSHYRTSREWIMPIDVITTVKRMRTSRLEDAPPVDPPAGHDPDNVADHLAWLGWTRKAIADGVPPEPEPYRATRHIGELRGVLRAVPAIEAKPREKSAEHEAAMEAARAELANREPVPMPDAEPEDETA